MQNFVKLKDLRENVAEYSDRVAKGESFIIMKRSHPIFRISPVDEGGWETVVDFTQFRKGGIPASELLEKLKGI